MADLVLGAVVDASTHQRTDQQVAIATGDLTTHAVIVGMTGSGKTGLGLVLIEEVLSAGVPCILIDPKGDLGDLCLLFPKLAPADFRPWINDGDAEKAGVSPDEFAAQQAQA
jgi:DNA helicase HerA-like ATPase